MLPDAKRNSSFGLSISPFRYHPSAPGGLENDFLYTIRRKHFLFKNKCIALALFRRR